MEPRHIDFDEVRIGDTLTFLTADNGFTGSGDPQERTGAVTKKTAQSICLHVGGGEHVFRAKGNRGESALLGATARLTRKEWSHRCPRLTARLERLPAEKEYVVYRDEGPIVSAFWTPCPEKYDLLVTGDVGDLIMDDDVVNLAVATRHTRKEGAGFSGWVVSEGGSNYGDALAVKREALASMRLRVDEWCAKAARRAAERAAEAAAREARHGR